MQRITDGPDTQSALFDEITQRWLAGAGLSPGMKVLDVGSGAGAVSFLAAQLVGTRGEVVGVDISLRAVTHANRRARELKLSNVRFVHRDAHDIHAGARFDAVIGRFILTHVREPAALLNSLARHARPGGIIAFQEADYSGVRFSAPMPLCRRCLAWIAAAARGLGDDPEIGLKLHRSFVSAGLPAPTLRLEASLGAGAEFPIDKVATELIAPLLPTIEELGIATSEEIGLETLGARLRTEALATGALVVLPPLIGAWVCLS